MNRQLLASFPSTMHASHSTALRPESLNVILVFGPSTYRRGCCKFQNLVQDYPFATQRNRIPYGWRCRCFQSHLTLFQLVCTTDGVTQSLRLIGQGGISGPKRDCKKTCKILLPVSPFFFFFFLTFLV
jgi:hypothetical protein